MRFVCHLLRRKNHCQEPPFTGCVFVAIGIFSLSDSGVRFCSVRGLLPWVEVPVGLELDDL